jgi:hypothetical protein
MGDADQFLDEAVRKVPAQHIRYQQRLLKRTPGLGQSALQDQRSVRNTLRAYVAEELADTGVAAHLGSFSLLHANTVKALNEVVKHLCLFARFDGEAVAG